MREARSRLAGTTWPIRGVGGWGGAHLRAVAYRAWVQRLSACTEPAPPKPHTRWPTTHPRTLFPRQECPDANQRSDAQDGSVTRCLVQSAALLGERCSAEVARAAAAALQFYRWEIEAAWCCA